MWPIPRLPFSFFMASSLNMLLIMPMPLWTWKDFLHFPSLVTIPADSWPLKINYKLTNEVCNDKKLIKFKKHIDNIIEVTIILNLLFYE